MKVVLDTNVIVSGIFYSGPPAAILKAWSRGKFRLVVSPEILDECKRVTEEFSVQFPDVDIYPILELIVVNSEVCSPPPFSGPVCEDPFDDKFLGAALAGRANIIVSGDKHLLKVSGYQGLSVLTPRQFVTKFFLVSKRPLGISRSNYRLKLTAPSVTPLALCPRCWQAARPRPAA